MKLLFVNRANRFSTCIPYSFARNALATCLFSILVLPAFAAEEPLAAPIQAAPEIAEPSPNDLPLPLDEVRIFAQVLNQIRSAYVEPIDDKTLLENAIKGMLAGIDPHSSYVTNDAFDQLQESTTGEFGGLGVEVGIENGLIKIISPMDDSPAARAGIQPGDLIIKINGRPAQEITLGDTGDMLRGEPGTSVLLTILREGVADPFEVSITREIIHTRSIRYREVEPGYGYIRISQFAAKTGDEVVDALGKMQTETPLKGLVLDLRNNPGGVVQAAVGVVDAFITEGLIVYTEGRIENSKMRFEATPEDPSKGVPLVVLINGGSASASEIVAGALQDHQRAIIMGTQSFGKGSVQTVLNLGNERAIKLTTSLYFTPNGRSIQATGITPDITVDRGQVTKIPDSLAAYREADLNRHLDNGNAAETEEGAVPVIAPAATAEPAEVLIEDYQLNEALNVLKGLNILRTKG
jgi:carboxyl-terminal processing protease